MNSKFLLLLLLKKRVNSFNYVLGKPIQLICKLQTAKGISIDIKTVFSNADIFKEL